MRDLTRDNFGLLIAYLLPGFVCLWGVSAHSEAVRGWLRATPPDAPTIGGFLYATLASTAAGLLVSTVRWAVVDRAFALRGLRQPEWSLPLLAERLAAFETLVAHHYHYYKFHANMLVAVGFAYLARLLSAEAGVRPGGWHSLGFVAVEGLLLLGARDTLRKYYARTAALLGPTGALSPPRQGRAGRRSTSRQGLTSPGAPAGRG